MRTRWLFSFLLSMVALTSFAQTPVPTQPSKMFAPYVDMGKSNNNLPQIMTASGTKFFTLAFVQSQGCSPSWGGTTPLASESVFRKYIDQVRASGGDVIIAFGGYDGTDIAQACSDPATLQAALQTVIDKYKPGFSISMLSISRLKIPSPSTGAVRL